MSVERLEQLLDVGLAALRAGDEDMTLMALEEALKAAEALPQRADAKPAAAAPAVIYLGPPTKG